ATVNHMTSRFTNRGFSVVALSGELSQNERTHALQAMRDGRARVCIATDVAARGIDLPNLELVIHADIPRNRETLLHRSGRTGRAGRKGVCALIVPHNWRTRTERLLASADIKATWARPPSVDEIKLRDHERILSDPTLSEPMSEDEQVFAKELLARHSPEMVAAAFLRQHFADQAAPEELLDAAPRDPKPAGRDDFKDGVWFSLTVGRKQSAEPRWLLPMLCRAGHITKHDVGAIRILQSETFVELKPACVERFLEAIGPSLKMEKTISITRLKGRPEVPSESRKDRSDKPHKSHGKKKAYNDPNPGAHGKFKAKRTFSKKPHEQAADAKPLGKPETPSKDKKPYKSKFAKTGAYKGPKKPAASAPGSGPRMRKRQSD
ncbi:MAG: DbpA RNA binding domain-containing protein, partial [Rhodospirillales bacterium]|nr:DbpA RNA binding domain-containing protein [Rhodospirillales bacterium]